jgi:putative addiction module component (TIGR02574 family)
MKVSEVPQIKKLSKAEKILFVEDLWDEIAKDDTDIPVPESHKHELDKRLDDHKKFPGSLLTLEELQRNIKNRK